MKNKLAGMLISLALCVCAAVLGLLAALGCSLWSENWIMHSMDAVGYHRQLADRVRADCGALAAQTGVLGTVVNPLLPDEMVRQDVILLTDGLFRNTMAMPQEPFRYFAVQVEDLVYKEMQVFLTEEEKQLAQTVQQQCARQYIESIRPPFQVVLSILLQYRRMAGMTALAAALLAAAAVSVLRRLYGAERSGAAVCGALAAAGGAVIALGFAARLCGYQSWMPQQNLEYPLFVYWFGGLPAALWAMGAALAVLGPILSLWREKRKRVE